MLVGHDSDNSDVGTDVEHSSSLHDDVKDGVMSDDERELFAVGRKRLKKLRRLKIGDNVAVLSEDGVLWIGELKDFRTSERSSSSSSSSHGSSGSTVQEAQVHWWDYDRTDPNAEVSYKPCWSRIQGPKPSRKRRVNNATVAYMKNKPRGNWIPRVDWIAAKSIVYWCDFGSMTTRTGQLTSSRRSLIQQRLALYDTELKLQ